jgi:hypothetical protein
MTVSRRVALGATVGLAIFLVWLGVDAESTTARPEI